MDKTEIRAQIKLLHQQLKALWPERKALPHGCEARAVYALTMAQIRCDIAALKLDLIRLR